MSAANTATLHRIEGRFDRQAIGQLRAEVARLGEENDRLHDAYSWADDAARSWQDDAMAAQDRLYAVIGSTPGITQQGQLVSVDAVGRSVVATMMTASGTLAAAVMSPFEGASSAAALDDARAKVVDLLEAIHTTVFTKAGPVVTLSVSDFESLMSVVDRARGIA